MSPPVPTEKERKQAKRNSEYMEDHFSRARILLEREEHRNKLEKAENPVLFSADGSEKLFKKVEVGPISHDEQQADMRIRGRGSIVSELDTRAMKEMGWNNYMGQNRKRRRKGKQTKKDKKDKKSKQDKKDKQKQTKQAKKDKKDKKTKKAKKKSSK